MQRDASSIQSIIAPHAQRVAELHDVGIVFVLHKLGPMALQALSKACPDKKDPVFALPHADAAQRFGSAGELTRAWLLAPAGEDQIKVFLISGDGTALLTLNFPGDGGVYVHVEPDSGDFN